MSVRVSVGLPISGEVPPGRILDFARQVEDDGLDTVSVADIQTGDGTAAVEPITTLAAIAGATSTLTLEFGVLSVPTRPLAMLAAQAQSLQHMSGGRLRLGLGIGGFAHSPYWDAVGADLRNRGRQLDQALELLPRLIAGEPTTLPGGTELTLRPAAPVPPLLVGSGDSEALLQRIGSRADGWVASALTPAQLAAATRNLAEIAEAHQRPAPAIAIGLHAVLGDDAAARATRERLQAELGEFFGLEPADVASVMLTGSAEQVAEQMAHYLAAGASEIGVAFDGPDPFGQLELLTQARAMVP